MTEQHERALRELIERNGGTIKPMDVVAAATPTESPLHDLFEWDDTEAARRWREEQARGLIQRLRITQISDTATVTRIMMVRDPDAPSGEQGYISTRDAKADRRLSSMVLIAELDRIIALANRACEVAGMLDQRGRLEPLLALAQATRASIISMADEVESAT